MYIRNKKNAPSVRYENGEHTYELFGRVEGRTNHVSIAYIELEPGQEALRHEHIETEEIFYILAGNGIAKLDNENQEVYEGDCIYVSPGTCHSLFNNTDKKLIYLSVCTPAWLRHSGKKC